jgi:hypothetical protein
MDSDNQRWIPEPKLYRRLRRIKDVWRAFRFLLGGGKFRIRLDFTGVDPLILKQPKVYIVEDGQVVDLAHFRHNARGMTWNKALADLQPAAADDPDGFRVKWTDNARKRAMEGAQ